jgi:hypothetical protein
MVVEDFHDEADELAAKVEREIQAGRDFLAALPEFKSRNEPRIRQDIFEKKI